MRQMIFWVPLTAIVGCSGGGGSVADVDIDEDGFYSDVDCNDQEPLINPGAIELCDGLDNDCDGEADEEDALEAKLWFPDSDGDGFGGALQPIGSCEPPSGYSDNPNDCDDKLATVNPNAIELCDGFDNDCDGIVDEDSAEDAIFLFRDFDGDGYGNPYISNRQCYEDDDYVLNDLDCDDARADVHPDGQEVCDEDGNIDEDCDGLYDDGDDTVLPDQSWFIDEDNDGYGSVTESIDACLQPPGFVGNDADCDDEDVSINPEGIEFCADELDNDCDTFIDEDDKDARDVRWYTDNDEDGFGDPALLWGETCVGPKGHVPNPDDCNDLNGTIFPGATEVWYDGVDQDCARDDDFDADADGVTVDTDCEDTDPAISPAAVEICDDGLDNDCDEKADPCVVDFGFSGIELEDELGWSMQLADVDGDDVPDLILGAPYHDSGATGAGAVYILSGPVSAGSSIADARRIDGEDISDALGWSIAAGADLDGDSHDDLVLGAYRADGSVDDLGAAYVLSGPITGAVDPSDAVAVWLGEAEDDAAAWVLDAGGDVDGDGSDDLLISAVDADSGAGTVYVAYGPMSGSQRLWGAGLALVGESSGDAAGHSAAFSPDLNGDGLTDIVVGAPRHSESSYEGAAYMVFGADSLSSVITLSDADGIWIGEAGGDEAGYAVAPWADINGDGYDEILVGAPGFDGDASDTGAVYVLQGPATGLMDLSSAAARLDGLSENDRAGEALSAAGDLDDDGIPDFLVGAPGTDRSVSGGGAAYLVHGPVTGVATLLASDGVLYGPDRNMALGTTLLGGDLNADGIDDALIAAPSSGNGEVFVILGGGW
jgi:hypothetical protein